MVDRIRNSLESKVVLQTAVEEVASLLELDRCLFFWYFEDTQHIQVMSEYMRHPTITAAPQEARKTLQGMGYYPLEIFGTAAQAITQGELVFDLSNTS
jgi:GAF domain-containing protein